MHLGRAMIYVHDIRRMVAFYGGTLGLKVRTLDETYAEFDGAAVFALHQIPNAEQYECGSTSRPREGCPIKLSFEVKDIEKERERLAALGVPIVQRPWGAYDGIDPEGNVFGLCVAATVRTGANGDPCDAR